MNYDDGMNLHHGTVEVSWPATVALEEYDSCRNVISIGLLKDLDL